MRGSRKRGSRTIVITGASAGVGRATARQFAGPGVKLALIARGRAGLDAAAAEARAAGAEALALSCDVADAEAVEQAAATIESTLGEIDVWVNAAMTAVLAEVTDTTAAEFRRVTEVTYLGAVHGWLAALRRMVPRDSGKIIQVGSALGYRGIPLQATYCGAKHAVQGFYESVTAELRHRGSHVSTTIVQLPGLDTPQFSWVRARTRGIPRPVPPVYQPEVAARAIVWAADHDRSELWVGRPTVFAILGNRLAPRLVGRWVARTGFKSQQSDAPLPSYRPDNLFRAVDEERDHGARGLYQQESLEHSLQLTLSRHKRALFGAGLAASAASAAAGVVLTHDGHGLPDISLHRDGHLLPEIALHRDIQLIPGITIRRDRRLMPGISLRRDRRLLPLIWLRWGTRVVPQIAVGRGGRRIPEILVRRDGHRLPEPLLRWRGQRSPLSMLQR
jgi:short-subunit dehydrogenase